MREQTSPGLHETLRPNGANLLLESESFFLTQSVAVAFLFHFHSSLPNLDISLGLAPVFR